jgi:hypothetical protein
MCWVCLVESNNLQQARWLEVQWSRHGADHHQHLIGSVIDVCPTVVFRDWDNHDSEVLNIHYLIVTFFKMLCVLKFHSSMLPEFSNWLFQSSLDHHSRIVMSGHAVCKT